MMKKILIFLIKFYRDFLSPLKPPARNMHGLLLKDMGLSRGAGWPFGAYCAVIPFTRVAMIPCHRLFNVIIGRKFSALGIG